MCGGVGMRSLEGKGSDEGLNAEKELGEREREKKR